MLTLCHRTASLCNLHAVYCALATYFLFDCNVHVCALHVIAELQRVARVRQITALHERLKSCNRVTIFGAGIVGTELAAEIADFFPDKQLCIRVRGDRLLHTLPAACHTHCNKWFQRRGVQIIYHSSIKPQDYKAQLQQQRQQDSELVFDCTGNVSAIPTAAEQHQSDHTGAHTSTLSDVIQAAPHEYCDLLQLLQHEQLRDSKRAELLDLQSFVDGRGMLACDAHLRLPGESNIFVIGDVVNDHTMQAKTAYLAEMNGHMVNTLHTRNVSQNRWQLYMANG